MTLKGIVFFMAIVFCIGGWPWSYIWVYLLAPNQNGERVSLRNRDKFGGSGNVGASNGLRFLQHRNKFITLLRYLGLITFDASKGYLSVWLAQKYHLTYGLVLLAGAIAVIGHCFPIWLGFQRGKGISTTTGVLIALHFYPELILALIAIMLMFLCGGENYGHRISVASIAAAWTVVLVSARHGLISPSFGCMLLVAIVITIQHRENIVRLLNRTEPKLTFSKVENLASTG